MTQKLKKNSSRILLVLVLGPAILALLSAGSPALEETPAPMPSAVRVAVADRVEALEELRFSGVTRGVESARAAFTLPGRVETRPVDIGTVVNPGNVLATLDAREYRNGLAQARAALAEAEARLGQAQRDIERSRTLEARGAATREETEKVAAGLDAVEAGRNAAQARVDELERLIDEAVLRAPIRGTVTAVFREPGEYTAPGQPIAALSGQDNLEVEIELPEAFVAGLKAGQEVVVELPLAERAPVRGRITSLGASALGPGRLFPVVVGLGADGLLPGMTAEVVLQRSLDNAVAVPFDALVNPGGRETWIFAVADESNGSARVERRSVDIHRLLESQALVAGSVAQGDRVVVEGHHALLDGDTVRVLSSEVTP